MNVEDRLAAVERRLAESERREARYRRLTLASLSLVMVTGLVLLARPAESEKMGTELKAPVQILDRGGQPVFELGSGNGMPYLVMFNSDQEVIGRLGGSVETGGGYLDLLHASGREAVSLSTDNDGGLVRTFDKQHRSRVSLGGSRFGGSVVLSDAEGSFAGWLHMREKGSVLHLSGEDQKHTAYLGPMDGNFGQLILYTPEDQKGTRFNPGKKE